jgi:hypothetical protein
MESHYTEIYQLPDGASAVDLQAGQEAGTPEKFR